MTNQKNRHTKKLLIGAGITAVVVFIAIRLWQYQLQNDGFSGMSAALPLLLIGTLVAFLLMSCFFAAWVYQDCRRRGDDGLLWAVIVFFTTPFIGLLVYLLRRPEQKADCPACRHKVSILANYCQQCGTQLNHMEEYTMKTTRTHHIHYLVIGMICMILTLTCLATFIVKAASGNDYNTSVTSDDKVWNVGSIRMNYNTHLNGVWKLSFKNASDGYVSQDRMTITDAEANILYADITCHTVLDNATLILYMVQGDTAVSVDVTNLSQPLAYPLQEFEDGEIHVRLQINGVEDTVSEIYIK